MTRLYLVRHGETEWNLIGRWQGHTDIPLNDIGLQQAHILADRLRNDNEHFTAIYSSDLARAWQTAEAIGDALGLVPVPDLALREIDIGWWGGLTRAEIEARDSHSLSRLDAEEDLPRGGGETMRDVYVRASTAIEQIVAAHAGETLIIVSHGGTMRALLAHARGNGTLAWPLPFESIGNTAVSIIEHNAHGWHVLTTNDTTHLAQASRALDVLAKTQDDAQQS